MPGNGLRTSVPRTIVPSGRVLCFVLPCDQCSRADMALYADFVLWLCTPNSNFEFALRKIVIKFLFESNKRLSSSPYKPWRLQNLQVFRYLLSFLGLDLLTCSFMLALFRKLCARSCLHGLCNFIERYVGRYWPLLNTVSIRRNRRNLWYLCLKVIE